MRALIVVDVQNDSARAARWPWPAGPRSRGDLARCAPGRPVGLRGRHPGPPRRPRRTSPSTRTSWTPGRRTAGPAPRRLVPPGWDVAPIEAVFDKGAFTAAYSGFEGRTPDGAALRSADRAGVTEVTWWASPRSLRAGHRAGLGGAGFATTVLLDLCAGVAPNSTDRALTELRAAGVTVDVSDRVDPTPSRWNPHPPTPIAIHR